MRLLVVTAAYPSPSEPTRGVFIETLTRAQVASGDTARVVAPRVSRSDLRQERRQGIEVSRFSYPGDGRRLKEIRGPSAFLLVAYAFSCFALVVRQLARFRTDCVLCHWVLPCGPAAALAACVFRVPLVLVAHGSDVHTYAGRSRLLRCLTRWTLARAQRVVAVSRALEDALVIDFDVSPSRVRRVPMGVDGEVFTLQAGTEEPNPAAQDSRGRLGLETETPLVLFVGDLVPAKGVSELLGAWRLVQERGVRAQLVLAGDGPLRAFASNGTAACDASPRFLGRLEQHELVRWYRAADVVVLPSHGEGMPVSLMEALHCGVPIVASSVGGIPELLEYGRLGRLVPAQDVIALARELEALLTDSASREDLRRRVCALERDSLTASARARELRPCLEEACHGA